MIEKTMSATKQSTIPFLAPCTCRLTQVAGSGGKEDELYSCGLLSSSASYRGRARDPQHFSFFTCQYERHFAFLCDEPRMKDNKRSFKQIIKNNSCWVFFGK
jgi:hypothetical protein